MSESRVVETIHILGRSRPAIGPIRYARIIQDHEFEAIRQLGLPEGWIAWHIIDRAPRKLQAMGMIPVLVKPGTMIPVDPISELIELGGDIRYSALLNIAPPPPTEINL